MERDQAQNPARSGPGLRQPLARIQPFRSHYPPVVTRPIS